MKQEDSSIMINDELLTEYVHLETNHLIDDLREQAKTFKRLLSNNPEYAFAGPIGFDEPMPEGYSTQKPAGVYLIVYFPFNQVVYVGQGDIYNRRARHKQVFKNKGKGYNSGKSSADSQAARKMYAHDTDLRNWGFMYFPCDKAVARRVENRLVEHFDAPFNSEVMSGVN